MSRLLTAGPTILALASSLFLNGALGIKVWRQNVTISRLTPQPLVPVGARPGTISGTNAAGQKTAISGGGSGTLVYVFAPTCGWCIKNANNISAVAAAARQRGLRVYAVSLDPKGAPEFLKSHGLDAELLLPDEGTVKRFYLGGTPQTFVLSADGAVIRNWPGAYSSKTESDVEAYFDIKLPGLVEPVKR